MERTPLGPVPHGAKRLNARVYILMGVVVVLVIAGGVFGWSSGLFKNLLTASKTASLPDSAVRTRFTLPNGSSFVLPGRHEANEFPYPSTVTVEATPQ